MNVVFDTVVLVRGLLDPASWSGKRLFGVSANSTLISDEVLELRRIPRPAHANHVHSLQ